MFKVRVLVSGEFPHVCSALEALGIACVNTLPDKRLPKPLQYHADLQFLPLQTNSAFILKDSDLKERLSGYNLYETQDTPTKRYPGDCLCNCLKLQNTVICNQQSTDKAVLRYFETQGLKIRSVNQGYTRCSTCVVDDSAIITADHGIATAAEETGIKVLRICEGHIRLSGYDYGFIGGSCGQIDRAIIFFGTLSSHPMGTEIKAFIKNCGVQVIEFADSPLRDIGGMVQLNNG